MKRRKALSLLLSLTLLLSLALPATTAYAEEGSSNKGMEISKTATANKDGSYTITLEAYATGTKVISEVTQDVPTDIILVLDQSGSMANPIGTVSFSEYTGNNARNGNLYTHRHNGGDNNLWHKLEDGSYVSVSVTIQEQLGYTEITNGRNESSSNGKYTNLYNNRNNLYALVNGEYAKVFVTRSGDRDNYRYTYTLPDGTVIATSNGSRFTPTISGTDDGKLYLAAVDSTQTVYTYTYTDSNGVEQTIGTSTGQNTTFTTTLYSRTTSTTGGGSRLAAIQTAVTNFTNAVTAKAKGADGVYGTTDDINHRIAVVGFAHGPTAYDGGQYSDDIPAYTNTEVFVGSSQYQYGTSASAQYGNAFQDMNTQAGYDNVIASKNALDDKGGTYTNLGLEMANGIFEANSIPAGTQRNRVVIVFTDGIPGESGYNGTVANNAISQASTAKNTYGATVYTIGVFSGADANSAGSLDTKSDADKGNYFLQRVSSNTQYPQRPSYYLSASDSASLNNIFKQISEQIDEGGSSSTLTGDAVVRDIVSPYFTLPSGATAANITLESYSYKGKSLTAADAWEKNETALGAEASIDMVKDETTGVEQNRVNVRGFNFSENWCGTESQTGTFGAVTYRGNKLVISFKVTPRVGFLGGNGVKTNNGAGVYENKDATTPVESVKDPTVDVAIKTPNVSVPDANVYLGAYFTEAVSAEALKNGTTVSFGTGNDVVTLDMSKPNDNWGLASWQNEYVDIEVVVKDANGNVVTEFSNLREDTQYTVSVTIKPKAATTGDVSSASGMIHVFKPELTYKDSTAYYGESVPTINDYSGNMVSNARWKNDTKYSTDEDVTMLGSQTPPTLDISYTPESGKIFDGKYGKQDVPVTATVKIGTENVNEHTTFVHQDCTGKTCTPPDGYHFWIHIQTCTLEIKKTGGAANESYVFDVYKDGEKYSEVTIEGNTSQTLYELPIGNYTIQENTGWSWRYSANNGGSAELTAQNPTGSITCTNSSNDKIYWLNGFSQVVRNIFGISH